MPADRLNPPARAEAVVAAVLDVLAGAGTDEAAARTGLSPADLAAAVALYREAGQRAIAAQTGAAPAWRQVYVRFTDWAKAEQTVADHIAPVLDLAEGDGQVTGWWFIRKHPDWRVRLLLPDGGQLPPQVQATLDDLAADGRAERWWPGIYEPETAAFGGEIGMATAHTLFHADSRAILITPHGDLGRREMSLLLCATLLRAAGLEWYEQGDVWHRVTLERPLPPDIRTTKLEGLAIDLRHLLLADTGPTSPMLQSEQTLKQATDWVGAFRRAGRDLGAANRDGTLDRGLRQILAYHVIFHWNRIGLPDRTQSALANAARIATLEAVNA